jgi:RimJ/RimL family protein N-acetyltransferase
MIALQTARLTLRYFTTDDAPFLLALLNTEGFKKYVGDRNVRTVADAVAYNKRFTDHYEAHGFGFYLVELTESRTPIGMCGLCRRESLPDVDVGFAFLPEYEGQGLAYEAAAACMLHARNDYNITSILGITVPYNTNSIRLLERIGLTFQKNFFMDGDEEELSLYATPSVPQRGMTDGIADEIPDEIIESTSSTSSPSVLPDEITNETTESTSGTSSPTVLPLWAGL